MHFSVLLDQPMCLFSPNLLNSRDCPLADVLVSVGKLGLQRRDRARLSGVTKQLHKLASGVPIFSGPELVQELRDELVRLR